MKYTVLLVTWACFAQEADAPKPAGAVQPRVMGLTREQSLELALADSKVREAAMAQQLLTQRLCSDAKVDPALCRISIASEPGYPFGRVWALIPVEPPKALAPAPPKK